MKRIDASLLNEEDIPKIVATMGPGDEIFAFCANGYLEWRATAKGEPVLVIDVRCPTHMVQ
jgi:hypothetical protein